VLAQVLALAVVLAAQVLALVVTLVLLLAQVLAHAVALAAHMVTLVVVPVLLAKVGAFETLVLLVVAFVVLAAAAA
jgi:hypothetical protein